MTKKLILLFTNMGNNKYVVVYAKAMASWQGNEYSVPQPEVEMPITLHAGEKAGLKCFSPENWRPACEVGVAKSHKTLVC